MPVRSTAIATIARALHGALSFNTLEDVARIGRLNGPRLSVPIPLYERRFGGVWQAVVDRIDWNRVLLEATMRHIALEHASRRDAYAEGPCGDCVAEALLNTEPGRDWVKAPKVERLGEATEGVMPGAWGPIRPEPDAGWIGVSCVNMGCPNAAEHPPGGTPVDEVSRPYVYEQHMGWWCPTCAAVRGLTDRETR